MGQFVGASHLSRLLQLGCKDVFLFFTLAAVLMMEIELDASVVQILPMKMMWVYQGVRESLKRIA